MNIETMMAIELDKIQHHLTEARNHVKSVELHPCLNMMTGRGAERRELEEIARRLSCLSFDLARREVALAVLSQK